jgi:CopG family transcriptional regulator/antitoxin EndoAI
MASKAASAYERINVTLPRSTLGLLDRVTKKGDRSRFIDEAIRERVTSVGRTRLRRQLAEGYRARAASDLKMVEEWFSVDEEAWDRAETCGRRKGK